MTLTCLWKLWIVGFQSLLIKSVGRTICDSWRRNDDNCFRQCLCPESHYLMPEILSCGPTSEFAVDDRPWGMWWWLESPRAVMLLMPLTCVSLVTLVWLRSCTCGLGCCFSSSHKLEKDWELMVLLSSINTFHSQCVILVITGERSSGLEWPPSHPKKHNCQEAFPALWAFSSEITPLSFAARAGPCGPDCVCPHECSLMCSGWWSPGSCGVQLPKLFWLHSTWL